MGHDIITVHADSFTLWRAAWDKVLNTREEVIKAFVAKYGLQPDEVEMIEEHRDNTIIWYVRKRKG